MCIHIAPLSVSLSIYPSVHLCTPLCTPLCPPLCTRVPRPVSALQQEPLEVRPASPLHALQPESSPDRLAPALGFPVTP